MQITIDLPEETIEKYRKQAELHHRDLLSEIKEKLLEKTEVERKINLDDPVFQVDKYIFKGEVKDMSKSHDESIYTPS